MINFLLKFYKYRWYKFLLKYLHDMTRDVFYHILWRAKITTKMEALVNFLSRPGKVRSGQMKGKILVLILSELLHYVYLTIICLYSMTIKIQIYIEHKHNQICILLTYLNSCYIFFGRLQEVMIYIRQNIFS